MQQRRAPCRRRPVLRNFHLPLPPLPLMNLGYVIITDKKCAAGNA
jgi:hypothetical protein